MHRADATRVTSERREKESRRKHTNRGTETPEIVGEPASWNADKGSERVRARRGQAIRTSCNAAPPRQSPGRQSPGRAARARSRDFEPALDVLCHDLVERTVSDAEEAAARSAAWCVAPCCCAPLLHPAAAAHWRVHDVRPGEDARQPREPEPLQSTAHPHGRHLRLAVTARPCRDSAGSNARDGGSTGLCGPLPGPAGACRRRATVLR